MPKVSWPVVAAVVGWLLTLGGVYAGLSREIGALTAQNADLHERLERQEANVHELETWLRH